MMSESSSGLHALADMHGHTHRRGEMTILIGRKLKILFYFIDLRKRFPETCGPPTSASQVLDFQVCPMKPSLSVLF